MRNKITIIISILLVIGFIGIGIFYIHFVKVRIEDGDIDILGINFNSDDITKIEIRTYFDNGEVSSITNSSQINEIINMISLITEKATKIDTDKNYANGETVSVNIVTKQNTSYLFSVFNQYLVCNNGVLSTYEITDTTDFTLNIYSMICSNHSNCINNTLSNYVDYLKNLVVYEGYDKTITDVECDTFGKNCKIGEYIVEGKLIKHSNQDSICVFFTDEQLNSTNLTNDLRKHITKLWNCKSQDILLYVREGLGVIVKTSLYKEPVKLLCSLLKIRYGNIQQYN